MISGPRLSFTILAAVSFFAVTACNQRSQAPHPTPVVPAAETPKPLATPAPVVVVRPPTSATPKPKRKLKARSTTTRFPSPAPLPPRRPPGLGEAVRISRQYHAAAAWASVPNTEPWTTAVIRAVHAFIEDLDGARDVEEFCPGYEKAHRIQRDICWLRLISKVAKFESNFNPHEKYLEPMGMMSVGLMQLSDGECILPGNRKPDLENPVHNLKCAVAIMARLIRRDHYIDGPIWARGAAAYWSTLRPPYRFLNLHLGKRHRVEAFTKTYLSY